MDPQTVERAIKRCIDISTRLGALKDELPPGTGSIIVQCVDEIDEMTPAVGRAQRPGRPPNWSA